MKKINPQISQKFLEQIKNQTSEIIDIEGVKIKTCRGVFPPKSNFSHTSEKLHTVFGDLHSLDVLDVGTGTGVQAIQAIRDGARSVVALDISPLSISCARENLQQNGVLDKVTLLQSDLFENLDKDRKFDLIIANLPITDFPLQGVIESALYDPGYRIHTRFLLKSGIISKLAVRLLRPISILKGAVISRNSRRWQQDMVLYQRRMLRLRIWAIFGECIE